MEFKLPLVIGLASGVSDPYACYSSNLTCRKRLKGRLTNFDNVPFNRQSIQLLLSLKKISLLKM